MDHREAAVRALPEHLKMRMAQLALAGWQIEYHPRSQTTPTWSARYRPGEVVNANGDIYTLKVYSTSTLLTLLDQMVDVVADMQSDDLAARYYQLLGAAL